MRDQVDGIILAAGLSTRMGHPKLLLEIKGHPIIELVVRAALESLLSRVILVSAPSFNDLTIPLGPFKKHNRLEYVTNPHPENGMASSLQNGIRRVEKRASGVMVILADQPWLTSKIIDFLLAEFCKDASRIVLPSINGRRTTPVIFPARFYSELMQVTGDIGGRSVLNKHPDSIVAVEMGNCYDDLDVDTPQDYEDSKHSSERFKSIRSYPSDELSEEKI
jgi:molybdenum cofactor cytidylyltransferase